VSCRIAVLISGSGSNLQALIDQLPGDHCQLVAVLSNRAEALGLQRAAEAGIATRVLDHREFASREDYDQALVAAIDAFQVDLVVLAGFMRILTPAFVRHYHGRLLNIHPSLLPLYKGLHTHRRALQAGDREHGASVHFVSEELDGGPVILQARVAVLADDDEQRLAQRVLQQEHSIYPLAVRWFAEGRLRINNLGRACLDGEPIPPGGIRLEDLPATERE